VMVSSIRRATRPGVPLDVLLGGMGLHAVGLDADDELGVGEVDPPPPVRILRDRFGEPVAPDDGQQVVLQRGLGRPPARHPGLYQRSEQSAGGVVPARPLEHLDDRSKFTGMAVRDAAQRTLDHLRADRGEVEECPGPAGYRNGADVGGLAAIEVVGPPDGDPGEGGGVPLPHDHLDRWSLERCRGSPEGVDAGMEHHDGSVLHDAIELSLRQPAGEPLAPGKDAVLAGCQSHEWVADRRVGPNPERITHRYGA